jgi:hypothetical protein
MLFDEKEHLNFHTNRQTDGWCANQLTACGLHAPFMSSWTAKCFSRRARDERIEDEEKNAVGPDGKKLASPRGRLCATPNQLHADEQAKDHLYRSMTSSIGMCVRNAGPVSKFFSERRAMA